MLRLNLLQKACWKSLDYFDHLWTNSHPFLEVEKKGPLWFEHKDKPITLSVKFFFFLYFNAFFCVKSWC